MYKKKARIVEISDALETGVKADIWYGALDFDDLDNYAEIEKTQQAMLEAAKLLRHLTIYELKTPWDFVEKYFPNYSGSDEIAFNNDLQKLIDEEYEEGDSASQLLTQLEKAYPSLHGSSATRGDTLQRLKNESDLSIYIKAIENYGHQN